MKYSIDESTLSALGEATRRFTNPTRIEEWDVWEWEWELELHGGMSNGGYDGWQSVPNYVSRTDGASYCYMRPKYPEKGYQFAVMGFRNGAWDPATEPEIEMMTSTSWHITRTDNIDEPCILLVRYTNFDKEPVGKHYSQEVPNTLTPGGMVEVLNNYDLSGMVPESALTITGDCQYRFASNGWNWFINQRGDLITTKDIQNAKNMFNYSDSLVSIPFEINMKDNASASNISSIFMSCSKLVEPPKINWAFTSHVSFENLFGNCHYMKEVPAWFIDLLRRDHNISGANLNWSPYNNLFNACRSLREIPDEVMLYLRNGEDATAEYGSYYSVAYCKPFSQCHCLNKLVNVWCDYSNFTSNQFSSFFDGLSRIADMTFAIQDNGEPYTRNWKSQTLDLSNVGITNNTSNMIYFNSGITADKEVTNDETYQALKNDPDWFTRNKSYSRYNHDSAVNTINSLPIVTGTGNTIKFSGIAGEKTDGGAINTLTEEEIAVAAARGWTITLV